MIARSALVGIMLVASQAASAVTIGGFDIDPTKAVASFSNPTGSFSTNSTPTYSSLYALGNSWGGVYNGTPATGRRLNFGGDSNVGYDVSIKATFTAPIVNQAGYDFYVFESGDASNIGTAPNAQTDYVAVSLTGTAGTWTDMKLLAFLPSNTVGGPDTTAYGVYVYGIDFSSLGLANGALLTSLFFGNTTTGLANAHDPDIVYGAGATASPVPVPAALPLFASALFGGGVIAWRKRRKRNAETLAA